MPGFFLHCAVLKITWFSSVLDTFPLILLLIALKSVKLRVNTTLYTSGNCLLQLGTKIGQEKYKECSVYFDVVLLWFIPHPDLLWGSSLRLQNGTKSSFRHSGIQLSSWQLLQIGSATSSDDPTVRKAPIKASTRYLTKTRGFQGTLFNSYELPALLF